MFVLNANLCCRKVVGSLLKKLIEFERFMDDSTPRKLNILPDHFAVPTPTPTTGAAQEDSPSPSFSNPEDHNTSLR